MTNIVHASGLIKGKFENISNDGVRFNYAVRNKEQLDVFTAVAYSKVAEVIKSEGASGMRLIFAGRIASEKMNKDNDKAPFHNVLNITRVLSIGESDGTDYITGAIAGRATSKELKYTGSGNAVLNFNVASEREYKNQTSGEVNTYTTYVDVTAWSDLAESTAAKYNLPLESYFVAASGTLKPNEFEKEGETVHRINIWATELSIGGQVEAPAKGAASGQRASAPSGGGRASGGRGGRAGANAGGRSAGRNIFDDD